MGFMKGSRQPSKRNTKPVASAMLPAQASITPAETRKAYNDRLFKHIGENFGRTVRQDEARKA